MPSSSTDTGPSHPEEMRARVELRIGQAVAVLMGAILVPMLWLARDRVRMRPPTA